jgi:hypothetical protein
MVLNSHTYYDTTAGRTINGNSMRCIVLYTPHEAVLVYTLVANFYQAVPVLVCYNTLDVYFS